MFGSQKNYDRSNEDFKSWPRLGGIFTSHGLAELEIDLFKLHCITWAPSG